MVRVGSKYEDRKLPCKEKDENAEVRVLEAVGGESKLSWTKQLNDEE